MKKECTFKDVRVVYNEDGQGLPVLLLHGWGQNKEMMEKIEEHLSSSFHVFNFDLPGFGESDEPKEAWSVEDYRDWLKEFVDANHLDKLIIIAHSFGCRIAIRYAVSYPDDVYKMCLTGAAGIRPTLTLEQQLRTKFYKAGKWFLTKTGQEEKLAELQNKSGSEDYRNASGVMRGTFVKIVNDDVSDFLDKINCETLLVWGDKDDAVPLSMAKKMEETMPNAGLAIFEGDDHFAYWHQADRFNRVLDVFLKGAKA